MINKHAGERVPELREFIKENEQRLYGFCYYMLYGGIAVEDAILSVFRDFGHLYRRLSGGKQPWEQMEIRLQLFTMAWHTIRAAIVPAVYSWPVGRDMRQLKGIDEDLLHGWDGTEKDLERLEPAILEDSAGLMRTFGSRSFCAIFWASRTRK